MICGKTLNRNLNRVVFSRPYALRVECFKVRRRRIINTIRLHIERTITTIKIITVKKREKKIVLCKLDSMRGRKRGRTAPRLVSSVRTPGTAFCRKRKQTSVLPPPINPSIKPTKLPDARSARTYTHAHTLQIWRKTRVVCRGTRGERTRDPREGSGRALAKC